MPYIRSKVLRKKLNKLIALFFTILKPNGTLNYFLFALAKKQCHSYNEWKEFIGELECVKQEIYRRQLAPYEDKKIDENGDVDINEF